jgi:uncharacterized membrane protein
MTDSQKSSAMTRIRNYFLTGIIVTAPIAITIYLTWSVIQWVDSWVKPYIPARYNPDNYLQFSVPGFGVIIALVVITLIGFVTANFVGRAVVGFGERLLNRMPLVRNVYKGLKQIFATVLANRAELFNKVALYEYPRRGTWSLVFIAKQQDTEINQALAGDHSRTIAVFRPITPNITTGYLLYVDEKELIPIEMSVEDAAKMLISAGLVGPEIEAKTKALVEAAKELGQKAAE